MTNAAPDSSRRPTCRRHREMLVIVGLVIVASFLLRVQTTDRVVLAWVPDFALPPLCLAREWFGISCPACGLTRSFVHLAHGDWEASWQVHHLGWLFAVVVLLQIPYRIHGLCRPAKPLLSFKARKWFGQGLIALLVINWLIGMFR